MKITESQCKHAVNLSEVIAVISDAFNSKDNHMVPKTYLEVDGGDFRAMPARVGNIAGIKWISVFPQNVDQPTVIGTILLNSTTTGELLAILEGNHITTLRTAAAAAVATRLLARKNSDKAAFVGCGAQTAVHMEAILEVQDVQNFSFFDIKAENAHMLAEYYGGEAANSVQDCVEGADIVTTLTPSKEPVVKGKWLKPGVHINAMGADAEGKREFDSLTYRDVDIWVVDDFAQAVHSGETQHAYKSRHGCMASMPWGKESGKHIMSLSECLGRTTEDQITFFDSTGLAIQDIAVAKYIYEKLRSEQ
tara:strand:- start:47393 stop:48313 length:921 start_codon:yes stop_codon:yes gene_type:complete